MAATQCLEINEIYGITMVHLPGDQLVEGNEIEGVGQALYQLIESQGRRKVVLDFSSVGSISGAALGKLIVLQKKVNAHDCMLRFCCLRPDVQEVFTVTKLDRLFDIRNNEAEALATFDRRDS